MGKVAHTTVYCFACTSDVFLANGVISRSFLPGGRQKNVQVAVYAWRVSGGSVICCDQACRESGVAGDGGLSVVIHTEYIGTGWALGVACKKRLGIVGPLRWRWPYSQVQETSRATVPSADTVVPGGLFFFWRKIKIWMDVDREKRAREHTLRECFRIPLNTIGE